MTGTKRKPAPSGGDGVDSTRSRKAHKASSEVKEKGQGKHKAIPRSTFQHEALPIHVNITHTPGSLITKEGQQTSSSDPGHIGGITMLPTVFSTGSYGWKGARRATVELQATEGKEKEKVRVMINVNATVIGSKEAALADDDSDSLVEGDADANVGDGEGKEEPTSANEANAEDVGDKE